MNQLCPADGRNNNNGSAIGREVIHYVLTYIGNDNSKDKKHEMTVSRFKNIINNYLKFVVQIKSRHQLTVIVAKISKGGIHIYVYSSWDGKTFQSVRVTNYCDLATVLHPKNMQNNPTTAKGEEGKRLADNTSQMQQRVSSITMNKESEVNEFNQ
jgi:hypothetical protein